MGIQGHTTLGVGPHTRVGPKNSLGETILLGVGPAEGEGLEGQVKRQHFGVMAV